LGLITVAARIATTFQAAANAGLDQLQQEIVHRPGLPVLTLLCAFLYRLAAMCRLERGQLPAMPDQMPSQGEYHPVIILCAARLPAWR
jgi:hypothetical protein